MTGFAIRNMAHPRTAELSERWYDEAPKYGINCQLAFDFLSQGNDYIVDLPAPPRKKYLGKTIHPGNDTGQPA